MSKPHKHTFGRVQTIVRPDFTSEKRYLLQSPIGEVAVDPVCIAKAIDNLLANDDKVDAFSVSEMPDGRVVMSITLAEEPADAAIDDVVRRRPFEFESIVGYVAGAHNMFSAGFLICRGMYIDLAKGTSAWWGIVCGLLCFAFGCWSFWNQRQTDNYRLRRELKRVSSKA